MQKRDLLIQKIEQRIMKHGHWGQVIAVESLQQYLDAIEFYAGNMVVPGLFVWRGQSDSSWRLDAKLFRELLTQRRIAPSTHSEEAEDQLQAAERQLLLDAKKYTFDYHASRALSELETFAILQHNGVPTRLLDFTRSPLIALWFAATEHLERDGIVIGVSAPPAAGREHTIKELLEKRPLCRYEPSHLIGRLKAQQSVFIVGQTTKQDWGSFHLVYWHDWSVEVVTQFFREQLEQQTETPSILEFMGWENIEMAASALSDQIRHAGIPLERRTGEGWVILPKILVTSELKRELAAKWETVLGISPFDLFPDLAGYAHARHHINQLREAYLATLQSSLEERAQQGAFQLERIDYLWREVLSK